VKVLDITLGSCELLERIKDWEVCLEPSLLDHRHIMFKLVGSVPASFFRDLRSTNWDSFREDLEGRLEQGPKIDVKDEAGLGLAIAFFQVALITAYEDKCPLKVGRKGKCSLKWTSKLESLRREVRQFFNKGRRSGTPQSWELYKEAQRRYKKEVRKASRDLWRAFCNFINDLPMSARLHRALSRDLKAKLSSLVAPSGLRTQSEGETLELLMTTHFQDSTPFPGVVASAAASRTRKHDWGVAAEMVTYRKVEWAINTFLPYKSPGIDGIFPALLQQGQRIVIPYLVKIFHACLAMGYVPAIWHQVKVMFIPKPGKNSYTGPRDFRPISLTSFLLKMLERLVDRYIGDGALVMKPSHPNQHAYQAGKSVETALQHYI
jgi:hypothetical protein